MVMVVAEFVCVHFITEWRSLAGGEWHTVARPAPSGYRLTKQLLWTRLVMPCLVGVKANVSGYCIVYNVYNVYNVYYTGVGIVGGSGSVWCSMYMHKMILHNMP